MYTYFYTYANTYLFIYNYTNRRDDMIKKFTEIGKLTYRSISQDYLNKNSDQTSRYRYNRNSALYLSMLEDMCADM